MLARGGRSIIVQARWGRYWQGESVPHLFERDWGGAGEGRLYLFERDACVCARPSGEVIG